MKRIKFMNTKLNTQVQKGFNLLEVLIGIAIFAIGMMALASLQGNLTRSASDANVRMVAVNLGEALIEQRRGFARISDPTDTYPAYDDIVTETINTTKGGTAYTVQSNVVDFYYDPITDAFTSTVPGSVTVSDYKQMSVTVSWTPLDLRTDAGAVATGASLGTGSITLVETISSVTSAASSKVLTQDNSDANPYAITYTPGLRPEIISLSLGNSRFKESLTPQPDVIRVDELVDTRFDVITYSQDDGGATFVRREEFAAVSCDCTLKAPSGTAETSGRRPAVWAGDEYTSFHWVDKPYGISANNQQSTLCETCCRDHHDGGSNADDASDTAHNQVYPFRATADYFTTGSFSGDHKHYSRANNGTITLATADGEDYVEACRLVRIDGFFKVAQDFRQEDKNVFPEDFLDDPSEVTTYSDYVTVAANDYENAAFPDYETTPPCIGGPLPCVEEPTFGAAYPTALAAGEFPTWTQLPLGLEPEQQLRSRGVYIDYLTFDLRTVVDCLRAGGTVDSCQSGDVILDRNTSTNVLEIIPFFDVQLTYLDRWNETPINTPVDATNEGLQDNNAHSRGVVSEDALGSSTVASKGHKNNLSFTDTAAIDLNYTGELTTSTLNVQSVVGTPPPPPAPGDRLISGTISESINGVRATDITVEGLNGALCDRTPGGFECRVPVGLTQPRVKILGYGKPNVDHWACLTGNVLTHQSEVINGTNAHHIWELLNPADPQPDGAGYNVNAQTTSCGGFGG